MTREPYRVRTEAFEGPLDLLLTLVERRKLSVNDISLAAVTDDFLDYLRELGKVPLLETAHFVLVAATLLLLKSKSLLPALALSEEESRSIEDLERRLRLYRRVKVLARELLERFGKKFLFPGGYEEARMPRFAPGPRLAPERIREALGSVLADLPKKAVFREAVVEKIVTLEEMIERLSRRIAQAAETSFREFARGAGRKDEIIVGFLALLELVKRGAVAARQEELFGDIRLESSSVGTPRYGA